MNESEKNVKSRKKYWILLLLAIVLGIVCFRLFQFLHKPEAEPVEPVRVRAAQVTRGSLSASSPVTGRISPADEAVIIPLAAGTVTRVNVKIGDKVARGAVLFEIDSTAAAAGYAQAAAAYASAKADLDRADLLYREGAVSLQTLEQARLRHQSALSSSQIAREAYDNCMVRSPISGYVTSLSVAAGSVVSQAPAGSVADVSRLVIKTAVSEFLISHLKEGDPVEISVNTLGSATFGGIISELSPAPAAGSLTYPATIEVSDSTGAVKAGMFAEVRVISREKKDVLLVPSDAVLMKNGQPAVVVLDGNIPSHRPVTTGLDNGTAVEIISGLEEGETVVTRGQQYIAPGTPVHIEP